jgi:peroxiredoxin Q/BCP
MSQLRVGDRAPDFSAAMQDGQTISLADLLGRRGFVLFFYPKDNTTVCTKEVCSFRDSYEEFTKAGVDVIGVSGDSAASHHAFAAQHRLPFPLISDSDGALRKAFGVSKTLGLIPGRVTYVIDQGGIIRMIFSALFASHEHVRQALAAVGGLNPQPDEA